MFQKSWSLEIAIVNKNLWLCEKGSYLTDRSRTEFSIWEMIERSECGIIVLRMIYDDKLSKVSQSHLTQTIVA